MAVIYTRMSEFLGISSTEANVRKIALNGYIFHVDLALVEELISLQYLCSHNFNQWRFMLIPSEVVSRKFRKMVYRSWQGTTGSRGMVPGEPSPSTELDPQGYQYFRDESLLLSRLPGV